MLIRENYGGESFSFKSISKEDIIEAVKNLPSNKASISNDIPISHTYQIHSLLPVKREQKRNF